MRKIFYLKKLNEFNKKQSNNIRELSIYTLDFVIHTPKYHQNGDIILLVDVYKVL